MDDDTRFLVLHDLAAARRFPLESREDVEALPRGVAHACSECGSAYQPVLVTTWSPGGSAFQQYPLAMDGWLCETCGHVAWPAVLGRVEASLVMRTGAEQARQGRFDEAELCFRRLVNSWPGAALPRVNLAAVYRARARAETRPEVAAGYRKVAEDQLQRALHAQGAPKAAVYLDLGRLYDEWGRGAEAIPWFEACVQHPELPEHLRAEAREALARARFETGRAAVDAGLAARDADALREAILLLERLVSDAPEHAASWWLLGTAYAGLGEAEEALPCFEKARDLDPSGGDVDRALGRVYLALGRGREAARSFDAARRTRGDEPALLAELALAWLVAQDLPSAMAFAERARRKGAADPLVGEVLELIEAVSEHRREAPKRWPEGEPG